MLHSDLRASLRFVSTRLQSLPGASKALLLHLLLRKRTWFQLSSLRYADVPQPEAAASRLSAVGLLQWDSDAHADLDALLQELPVVLLKQVLAALLPRGHPAIAAVAAAAAGRAEGARGPDKASVLSSIQVGGGMGCVVSGTCQLPDRFGRQCMGTDKLAGNVKRVSALAGCHRCCLQV